MDAENDQSATPGAAAEGQSTDVPGQEAAEGAHPQNGAEQGEGQSQDSEGGEKLSEEQKTIRKLQRRIDRLTAGRGAASREAELLREELAQHRQQSRGQDDEPKAIDPKEIDRLATERARELTRQQQVASKVGTVLQTGKKLEGFDQAVNAVAEEVPFTDRHGRPTPFIEAVLDADKPAEVLHWLGQNPDEAAAFASLTPAQIGRRLAQIESRIEREAKAKTSNAPAPLQPVKARATADGPSDSDDIATWMRKERERVAKRSGR